MSQPQRVSVEQLLQRLRYAEDAYGERLAAETERLRAENEKLNALLRAVRLEADPKDYYVGYIGQMIDESGLLKEQTP